MKESVGWSVKSKQVSHIDFLAVFEKAPDVAHYWAVVSTYQALKGALITCLSLPNQEVVILERLRRFVPLRSSLTLPAGFSHICRVCMSPGHP